MLCCTSDRQRFIMCDEITMALALDEQIATAAMDIRCTVETTGTLTRGQVVIEHEPFVFNAAKVSVLTAVNFERLVQLLTAALVD